MKTTPHLLLAALIFATPLPGRTAAVQFHVAPNGNDRNVGDAKAPFASPARARDAASQMLHKDPEQTIVVHLQGGRYPLSAPLRFEAEDTPAGDHHLTFKREGDTPVILSGGRVIEGWSMAPDGRWRVQIPSVRAGTWRFRELFLNGRRLTRARHPNQDYFRVETVGPDRRTRFTFRQGDVSSVPDLNRVELVFLHDWSISRIPVKSVDASSRTLTTAFPVGPGAPHYAMDHFEKQPRYFLENSAAYLDAPGEWHLDVGSGELRYVPRPGETLERSEFVAPVLHQLLEVVGNSEAHRPARNLRLQGIHFEHCAWDIPEEGFAGRQAAHHERRSGGSGAFRDVVPPALYFEMAEGCSLSDSRIAHVGGSGIWFGSRCHSNRIDNVTLTDVAGNGIMIGEDTARQIRGQRWWQIEPEQTATGNVIENSVIEDCGRQFFGSVGVWVGFARETLIVRNKIRNLPYTGVSVGWMWNSTPTPCSGNRVEENHIHHVMQILSDGGGIYTLGWQPGMRLRKNLIHDVPLNLGRAESNGMFLDEGTTGILIAENTISNVVRSPLRFHRATTNVVLNNVFHLKAGVPSIRFNNTQPEDITEQGTRVVIVPEL